MQIWETSWVKKWAWKNNYEENPDPKREHEKEEYVENPEQKIEYEEKKKKIKYEENPEPKNKYKKNNWQKSSTKNKKRPLFHLQRVSLMLW